MSHKWVRLGKLRGVPNPATENKVQLSKWGNITLVESTVTQLQCTANWAQQWYEESWYRVPEWQRHTDTDSKSVPDSRKRKKSCLGYLLTEDAEISPTSSKLSLPPFREQSTNKWSVSYTRAAQVLWHSLPALLEMNTRNDFFREISLGKAVHKGRNQATLIRQS